MKNAKIYKIELPDGKIYIGSTIQTIPQRQASHNRDLKKKPHQKLYSECIKQNITRIKCIWVEDVTVNSNCELRAREEYFRKLLNCELNTVRCHRTVDDKIQQKKHYYHNNKKELAIKQKEYYNNNKEELAIQKKHYYYNNKEELAIKQKQQRENNKEEITRKQKVKIECQLCGFKVNRSNISMHKKTDKCKKLSKLKLNNNEM